MKRIKDDLDRYQFQPWYIKLWRRRFYLLIIPKTIKTWIREQFRILSEEEIKNGWDKLSFRNCLSIHIGLAQADMNWVYSWDEVKERNGWDDLTEEDIDEDLNKKQ